MFPRTLRSRKATIFGFIFPRFEVVIVMEVVVMSQYVDDRAKPSYDREISLAYIYPMFHDELTQKPLLRPPQLNVTKKLKFYLKKTA